VARDWSEFEVTQKSPKSRDWSEFEVIEKVNPSFGQKLSGLGEGFRTGVERVTHGLLKPIAESGILGKHVKEGFDPYLESRKRAFEQAQEIAPTQTKAGKFIGDIGVRLPAVAAFAPAEGAGLLANILGAGKAGLTTGMAKLPEEDEYRTLNALEEGLESAGGTAALGTIAKVPGAIKGAGKYAKDVVKGFNPEKNLANLLKSKEVAKEPAKAIYNEIGSTLKEAGKDSGIKAPKIDWEGMSKSVTNEDFGPIKKLVDEGTYESLNQAQSKLSSIGRDLLKKAEAGADNTASRNAVRNAEFKIHGKLFERFNEVNPELANMYQKANELFAKAVKPYELDALKEFNKTFKEVGKFDKKLAKQTLDKLLEDPKFRLQLGEQFPEISRGKTGNKALASLLATGLTGAGVGTVFKLFKGK